jgi:hypothetical protein
MDEKELKDRTKRFALEIIKPVEKLPTRIVAQTVGRQLVKRGHRSGLITDLLAEGGRERNSPPSWVLLRKRQMKARSGWKSS